MAATPAMAPSGASIRWTADGSAVGAPVCVCACESLLAFYSYPSRSSKDEEEVRRYSRRSPNRMSHPMIDQLLVEAVSHHPVRVGVVLRIVVVTPITERVL